MKTTTKLRLAAAIAPAATPRRGSLLRMTREAIYIAVLSANFALLAGDGKGGLAEPVAEPVHEIKVQVVDGIEWTFVTGYIYIEMDAHPQEITYSDWVALNPEVSSPSGVVAVPSYPAVYIGDGTNVAVSANVAGHVNVPKYLGGGRVVRISANAFSNCTAITSVTVPKEVMTIEDSAFTGCSGITAMTLPFVGSERGNDGVRNAAFGMIFGERPYDGGTMTLQQWTWYTGGTHDTYCIPSGLQALTITDETVLSQNACRGLRNLRSLSLPSTLTKIGSNAFWDCVSLPDVVIPEGVNTINGSAFRSCINLTNVTIAASVTSIGDNAFNNTRLADVPAMPGMKYISDDMFADCWWMTKATIPEGIEIIGRSPFLRCPLKDVTIPSTVTNIGHYAFDNQRLISEIMIPASVKSIGVVAFRDCTNLTSIVLSEGLERIGDNAFSGCTMLPEVVIPESVSLLGVNEEGDRILGSVFKNCTALERVDLPTSLTLLADGMFSGCRALTDVKIPNGVQSIGSYVFNDCYALATIVIPSSVTNIDDRAVACCYGLRSVTIPGSVGRIADRTFELCTNLYEVVVGEGVGAIGYGAFADCSSLFKISIPTTVKTIGVDAFRNCVALEHVTFGEGIVSLDWGAFRGCSKISELELPSTLKTISGAAFHAMSGIDELHIPDSVTTIGESAFWGAVNMTSLEIGSGVETIPSHGFERCYALQEVVIPDNVRNIEAEAFRTCTSLVRIEIPESVTNLGDGVFCECSALREAVLPATLRKIGSGVFDGCTALEVLTVENGITELPDTFCYGCVGLVRVVLPPSVTAIGNGAFSMCSNLRKAWLPRTLENKVDRDRMFGRCHADLEIFYYDGDMPNISVLPLTVIFDANGGSVDEASRMTFVGEALGELPIPVRGDFTFDGWFSAAEGGDAVTAATVVTGNVTYYAHWTKVAVPPESEPVTPEPEPVVTQQVWTVMFDAQGGVMVESSRVVTNDCAVGTLPAPTRDRHMFDGWFTAAEGGDAVTAATVVTGNVTYYAHWTKVAVPPEPEPKPTPEPIPDPVMPGHEVIEMTDITAPYEAPKAVPLAGAVYDGNGAVVGIVELKLGKVNKGKGKVSGAVTMLDGKKRAIRAFRVTDVDGATPKAVSLDVKDLGAMSVTIGGSQFAGSLGGWHVQSAAVGGKWTKGMAAVYVDATSASLPAGTLEGLLPYCEPIIINNGKWSFNKAAGVKWAKPKKGAGLPEIYDEVSGKGLIIDTGKGKTNLSGLKLAYTPKKGTFKGAFKVYALEGSGKATKLKKYTVKVSGVVVDGVGYGSAAIKNGSASSVTIR